LPLAPPGTDGFVDSKSYGVSAELNWSTDVGKLTVLPAYRDLSAQYRDYVPGFLSAVSEDASQESLEARFATDPMRNVSFIVGTYLFHENRNADQNVDQTITGSDTQVDDLPTEAYAGFGQVQWRTTDSLRLTAGLRYSKENKSLDGQSIARGGAVTPLDGNLSFDNVSWRAGVEFDLNASSMLYANVSTAFKAGGFYTDAAPNNTYRPEKLTAYTIGSKNTFLDGRLRLNGEAFFWDYKDHQESHLAFGDAGIVFKTENVGKATMKGAEGELDYKVGSDGELTARAQYLDAVFSSFAYTSVVPIGAPVTGCSVTSLAPPSYRVTCDGMPATRSPRWSGNLSYSHNLQLGRYGRLTGTVDAEIASPQYLAIDYVPDERQAGYVLTDLSVAYRPTSDRYSVTVWVRNLANRAVLDAASQQLFIPSITLVDLRPPRTFGVSLSAKY
jgi:iron complex outermembrane receptor protein